MTETAQMTPRERVETAPRGGKPDRVSTKAGGAKSTSEIQIRDPFVVPVGAEGRYYLYGTTTGDPGKGPGGGFDCYRSEDLANWEGPFAAFRPDDGFQGTTDFWAPEVHVRNGRYYMFASFKAPRRCRGTYVLVSDAPKGPFRPISDGPVTPPHWQCLDGTLHVDGEGRPWVVFCHEWVQVHNGAVWGMRLTDDLKRPVGRPIYLFSASEAPWARPADWPADWGPARFPCYVTDGPFLHQASDGQLLMLWSTIGARGYTMGIARSAGGRVEGPWTQDPDPIVADDGGHGMIFRSFEGQLVMTFHTPNQTPNERACFVPIEEEPLHGGLSALRIDQGAIGGCPDDAVL